MLLDLVGPWEVFSLANKLADTAARPYEIELLSGAGPANVPSEAGISLESHRRAEDCLVAIDTLVVPAADVTSIENLASSPFDLLRRLSAQSRRTVSICGGAFLLAGAGLLDGKRATTHWRAAGDLAERFPKIHVDDDAIFVKDGDVYTSAGVTAGIDLALSLVEEDLGQALALRCAREMVVFMRRPGGQSQFSNTLAAQHSERSAINDLISWAADNPDSDLSVDAMAERVNMSTRNFSRVFRSEIGQTPAAFVEKLRVDAVRRCLEETEISIDVISRNCGFNSADAMRRSFRRVVKVAPGDYRRRFSGRRKGEPELSDGSRQQQNSGKL